MKNTFRIVAIVFCLLVWPAASSADQLVLPGGPTFLSTGDETIVFNGHVYFAADDGVKGNELWRTDGTVAGTTLVADLNVGNATSDSNPDDFTLAGNRLFFRVATTGVAGQTGVIHYLDPGGTPQVAKLAGGVAGNATASGLFGSVNGKALINFVEPLTNRAVYALGDTGNTFTKISTGSANVGSFPESATMGGYAYFPLCPTSCSAYELYRTDGSTVSLVKDINGIAAGSGPNDLVATGNRVYFEADDGTNGRELWVTDGSDPGTKMVKDHNPSGSTGIGPASVANGNTLFYVPNDSATGAEPWRTDGTPGGTSLVKDITPGTTGAFGAAVLFALGSGFGMVRSSGVYTSDGTDAGTIEVADVDSDGHGAAFLGVANSRGYFRGGFSPFSGAVWRTDGTVAGTGALTAGEFNLATPGKVLFPGPLTALGNKVIFFGQYPHAAGDPAPAGARRMYVLDTTQPDPVRQATAAPSISGTPAVGQLLTGNQGAWTLEPYNEYAFQWLRNGVPIPGSNARASQLQTDCRRRRYSAQLPGHHDRDRPAQRSDRRQLPGHYRRRFSARRPAHWHVLGYVPWHAYWPDQTARAESAHEAQADGRGTRRRAPRGQTSSVRTVGRQPHVPVVRERSAHQKTDRVLAQAQEGPRGQAHHPQGHRRPKPATRRSSSRPAQPRR